MKQLLWSLSGVLLLFLLSSNIQAQINTADGEYYVKNNHLHHKVENEGVVPIKKYPPNPHLTVDQHK